MSAPRARITDIVRLVSLVAGPASEAEWVARAPGEFPATCRFCGDPVLVEIIPGHPVRVAVSHDVPLCPEFARHCEDFPVGARPPAGPP